MRIIPKVDFKTLFESTPGLSLVLLTNFTIFAVSENYLTATMIARDNTLGLDFFEIPLIKLLIMRVR